MNNIVLRCCGFLDFDVAVGLYRFRSIPFGMIVIGSSVRLPTYSAAASDTAVKACRYFRADLVYGVTTLATVRLIMVSGSLAWNVAIFTARLRARICLLSTGTHGS